MSPCPPVPLNRICPSPKGEGKTNARASRTRPFGGTTNNHTADVTINGLVIHTQATDAAGIAADLAAAIKRNMLTSPSNSGQQ
jgi:hypothetical protein